MSIKYDKSLVKVLVVDDEDSIRDMLTLTLQDDGWDVANAKNGKDALEKLREDPRHIIISDINMPEMTGMELLEAAKAEHPSVEFIIMTSHATLETAVKAVKLGAYDYLNKPFEDISVVPQKIEMVAEKILLRQQNAFLLNRLKAASHELKNLLKVIMPLTGLLEIDDLVKSTLEGMPVLFQNDQCRAAWFRKSSGEWEKVQAIPNEESFKDLSDPFKAKESFPDYREIETVTFSHNDKENDVLVFENMNPALSEIFIQKVKISYSKIGLHRDVLSLANRDGLTRLYNHRYFQERIRQEISQARRQDSQMSVILMDVDHFKHYNDSNGHPAGDKLLKELSSILSAQVEQSNGSNSMANRETDIVARYGGEEFVMILPFTPHDGALVKAERIRKAVEEFEFDHAANQPLGKMSLSIGVSTFPDHGLEAVDLVEKADKALYKAKDGGRNQVCGAEPAAESSIEKPETDVVEALAEEVIDLEPVDAQEDEVIELEAPAAETSFEQELSDPVEETAEEVVEEEIEVVEESLEIVEDSVEASTAPAEEEVKAEVEEVVAPEEEVKAEVEEVVAAEEELPPPPPPAEEEAQEFNAGEMIDEALKEVEVAESPVENLNASAEGVVEELPPPPPVVDESPLPPPPPPPVDDKPTLGAILESDTSEKIKGGEDILEEMDSDPVQTVDLSELDEEQSQVKKFSVSDKETKLLDDEFDITGIVSAIEEAAVDTSDIADSVVEIGLFSEEKPEVKATEKAKESKG